MAKKHDKKHGRKAKKVKKKAARALAKHGPWAAAVAALGSIATTFMANKHMRKAIGDMVETAVDSAARALDKRRMPTNGKGREHGSYDGLVEAAHA